MNQDQDDEKYLSSLRALSLHPFTMYYGTPSNDNRVYMSPTSDGGFIVAGTTEYHGNKDVLVVKTDSIG